MDDDLHEQPRLLLIHGGLAEDMTADRFWTTPGVLPALVNLGWHVTAPDRNTTPDSWAHAAQEMARLITVRSTVVAASNGVSVGLRLAVDYPNLVHRLVLLWPATASDPEVDRRVPSSAAHLLAGETVRGLSDDELSTVSVPVAVMASRPENPIHQHLTVDRLADTIPDTTVIERAFPEAPHPDFAGSLDRFIATLVAHLR